MTDSILSKTARGAGWVVAWRMASRALGTVSTLLLVRLLAPSDFGLIALASSFSVSIEAFSWIGIEEGVIRHKRPDPALLDTAWTLSVLRGAVVFALIAAVAWPAAAFFEEPRLAPVLLALGATVLIENLVNVGTIEFRRDFDFRREFELYLLPRVLSIAVAIGTAASTGSYWALMAGIISNQVFRVLFSYRLHPYRPRPRLSAWRELAGYSVWNSVVSGAGALRDRVDTMMVGRLLGPAPVGVYALGFEIAALPVTELIAPLTRAAFAGFAAAWREEVDAGETWLRLVSGTALLVVPAAIGMSALAAPLVRLAFGPGWDGAVPVMQLLGPPLGLTVFGMVGQTLFMAHGHMRTSLLITVGATGLRLLLLLLLVPRFGLPGAAMAAGAAIATEQLAAAASALRRLGLRPLGSLGPRLWRCAVATAVMAAALWGSGLGWSPMGPIGLFAAVPFGAAAYGLALLLLWLLSGRPAGPEADLLATLRRAPPAAAPPSGSRVSDFLAAQHPPICRDATMDDTEMAQASNSDLFSPIEMGRIALRNRIVMAPLTRSRSDEAGVPNALMAEYYAQRATAGLIVSEATNISAQARGYAFTPGIFTDAQVDGWRAVTDAVHARDGHIVCQLWHTGRISHPDLQPGGVLPVAPSAIAPEGKAFTVEGFKPHVTPRALETDEIAGIVADYAHAAECAGRAGFDGVEIHAANCYLLDQFIRDSTNKRTDRYGGSVENRLRFVLEVVEAVTGVLGADRVGIRLSPLTTGVGNTPLDSDPAGTYGTLIDELNKFSPVYLHFIEGNTQGPREEAHGISFDAMRARFKGLFMVNNGFDREAALAEREADRADLICFGRPFIANPDLVERLRIGAPIAESDKATWYGGGAKGYTDYPALDGSQPKAA